jgi:hypothetical protein
VINNAMDDWKLLQATVMVKYRLPLPGIVPAQWVNYMEQIQIIFILFLSTQHYFQQMELLKHENYMELIRIK